VSSNLYDVQMTKKYRLILRRFKLSLLARHTKEIECPEEDSEVGLAVGPMVTVVGVGAVVLAVVVSIVGAAAGVVDSIVEAVAVVADAKWSRTHQKLSTTLVSTKMPQKAISSTKLQHQTSSLDSTPLCTRRIKRRLERSTKFSEAPLTSCSQ